MLATVETLSTLPAAALAPAIENRKSKFENSLSFLVPEEESDQTAFNHLPTKVRQDTDRLLLALEQVHSSGAVNPTCRRLAASLALHRPLGLHALRKKYYDYLKTGDWRSIVDWTRVKKHLRPGSDSGSASSASLVPAFIDFVKGLMQSNQRKSEPAIRLLYKMWREGASIPGYGTWQEYFQATWPHEPLPRRCPPDYPRGWSKANLRRYIPEDAELALARRGVAEARRHLPDILITRDGLRPLEFVMFDDVRTDFKILVPGFASPVELNCLVALDVATGVILRYGIRPAIPREDGMKDKLKLRDMKTLVAGLLLQYGLPRHYPMTLIVENATAAIKSDFEAALSELSRSVSRPQAPSVIEIQKSKIENGSDSPDCGPGIVVQRTEMICGSAIWAGYKDRSTGNPGGKAALESTFNLWHNEAAFLPGQTGPRYDAGPMELHGRTREAESLARTGKYLTPHQRAALRYPFLTYAQARVVMTDLWNQICQRTDHRMEAFEVLGEFRLSEHDQWHPESELLGPGTPGTPALAGRPLEWRNPPRKESPRERWDRLVEIEQSKIENRKSKIFLPLHPAAIARLYDEHRQATVANFEITFQYDKQPHYYRLADAVSSGSSIENRKSKIENKTEVLCYFDPSDLSWIHVTDGQGSYLGSIPETRGLKRTDKSALRQAMETKRAQLHALQDTVSARMPQQPEDRLADLDHNVNVLADALQEVHTVQPFNDSTVSAPAHALELGRAKLAAQVAQRQSAARQLAPVVIEDNTAELLARAEETETEAARS